MALDDPTSFHQKTLWPRPGKLAVKKSEDDNVFLSHYERRRVSEQLNLCVETRPKKTPSPMSETPYLEIEDRRLRSKRAFSEGFILSSSGHSSSSSLSQRTSTPPDTEPTGRGTKKKGLMGRLFHWSAGPKMKQGHREHSLSTPSLADLEKLPHNEESRRHSLLSFPFKFLDGLRPKKRRPSSLAFSHEDLSRSVQQHDAVPLYKKPSPLNTSGPPTPPLQISQEALKEIEAFEAFIEKHLEKEEIQFYI